MENPIKMDDLGGLTTIFGNTHMFYYFLIKTHGSLVSIQMRVGSLVLYFPLARRHILCMNHFHTKTVALDVLNVLKLW